MAEPEKIPFTVSSDAIAKVINTEMEASGNALLQQFHEHKVALDTSLVPSVIASELQTTDQKGRELAKFYIELAGKVEAESTQIIIAKEKDVVPKLGNLKEKKSSNENSQGANSAKVVGGGTVLLAILGDLATGGLSGGAITAAVLAGSTAAAAHGVARVNELEAELKGINGEITRLEGLLEDVKKNKVKDLQILGNKEAITTLAPKIMAYKAAHGKTLYEEVAKYADNHATTADAIVTYLTHTRHEDAKTAKLSQECADSFLALLRADYTSEDLAKMAEYARTVQITNAPEQRALLQFINHAVIPHQDYFEIWAGKVHDLRLLASDIQKAYEANNAAARPKLEILGEKPLAKFSPRESEDAPIVVDRSPVGVVSTRGIGEITEQQGAAAVTIAKIKNVLADHSLSIRERHEIVRDAAVGQIEKFNEHFGNIGAKLAEVDNQLNRMLPARDRLEVRWDRAMSNATQLALLNVREPKKRHTHHSVVNWASVGAGVVIDAALTIVGIPPGGATAGALGRIGAGEIRNIGTRVIADTEQAILRASLEDRNRIEPAEMEKLKKNLADFDAEIKKLSENREFLEFLSNNPTLEGVRAMYMLLPRLVAAKTQMSAAESKAKKAGFENVDAFVTDIRKDNPRLADAMENLLLGFPNTNDLRVIIAEANMIEDPKSPKEKALVDFVETLKKDYVDQSKQASIIDYLGMRNVLVSSRPFHSSNEIVRLQTEAALQALMAGKDEFSLIGSNDVHEIFADVQARHGDRYFLDPHAPHDSGKMANKRVQAIDPDEIKAKSEAVSSTRRSDTRIPRLDSFPNNGGIFIEICTHEYLLTQAMNIVKDKKLASSPAALGAMEMVNTVTRSFIEKLALESARQRKKAGDPKKPADLGPQIENLIALSFVEFFSELGAHHNMDKEISEKRQEVKAAYFVGNYSLATSTYTDAITENAQQSFGLFLDIYRHNLEKYLERATRENRKAILEQLAEVRDLMQDIQPGNSIVMPGTEESRLRAHYRNHSLSNMGMNPTTWAARAEAIHKGGSKEVH